MKQIKQIVVHKGRTVIVPVSLGYDVSGDVFESEIREEKNRTSDLIVAWDVSYLTDGSDGELILTLDDAVTSTIEKSKGYMDIKRVSGGEPLPVFNGVIEVLFRETVTA